MRHSYMPAKLAEAVLWSANFARQTSEDPVACGLGTKQAEDFAAINERLQAAWTVSQEPTTRTSVTVEAFHLVLDEMKRLASELASFIQSQPRISADKKKALGLTVRRSAGGRIVPAPGEAPILEVASVVGRAVKFRLRTPGSARSGKPEDVVSATVFTHVGPTPPATQAEWRYAKTLTRASGELHFPAGEGANTAWVTAFWTNGKGQNGPTSTPVQVNLPAAGPVPNESNVAPETPGLKIAA